MEGELRIDEPGQRDDPAPAAPRRRRRGGFAATYLTPKESIPPLAVVVLGVLSFVIPLGAWAVLTYGGVIDPFTLPTHGTEGGQDESGAHPLPRAQQGVGRRLADPAGKLRLETRRPSAEAGVHPFPRLGQERLGTVGHQLSRGQRA